MSSAVAFSLEITSHEKIRKSGSPEQLLQEQKKEKAYIIHYVRLTEPGREEGPFTGRNKIYVSFGR